MGPAWYYHLLGRRGSPLPTAPLEGDAADFGFLQDAATAPPSPAAALSPPRSLHSLTDAFLHTSFPIIVTVTFSVFCVFLLLGICAWSYCRRCLRDGGHLYGSEGAASPGYKRRNAGVDRAVVESLPVVPFRRGGGSTQCVVCLRRFAASELLRVLPKCMHAFHVGCVDVWLAAHCTCPICRRVVDPEDVLLPLREPFAGPKPHPAEAAAAAAAIPLERRLYKSEDVIVRRIKGGETKKPRCRSVDDALLLCGVDMFELEDAGGKKKTGSDEEEQIVETGESDGEGVLQNRRWSDTRPEDLRGLRRDMLLVDVEGCSVWHGRVSSCSCTGSISSSASSSSTSDAGVGWRGAPGTGRTALFGGRVVGHGVVRRWLTAAATWLVRPR